MNRLMRCLCPLLGFWVHCSVTQAQALPVPSGRYALGSADSAGGLLPDSDSLVTLGAFTLERNEVSNDEFCRFLNAGHGNRFDRRMEILELPDGYVCVQGRQRYPVHHVSWHAAREYAGWVGGRLPTAKEWEAAARGRAEEENGATRWYPWGPKPSGGSQANCQETQRLGVLYTWPADTLVGPGPFGHVNLAGNLAEWISEVSADSGWASVKGGCWADPEILLRSAVTVRRPAGEGFAMIGFRVAR
ncbi:MAG: formylglycine-generating enzyme family protein [Calditrichaeota bacterium]|nr:formylglycine-generating enzyme family protein [Calditrichota bacterium]MCB9473396.1 formylglycine-generating enzyme family protein [Candidatus Delongbacteria bacterium]